MSLAPASNSPIFNPAYNLQAREQGRLKNPENSPPSTGCLFSVPRYPPSLSSHLNLADASRAPTDTCQVRSRPRCDARIRIERPVDPHHPQVNGGQDIFSWLQTILFPAWNDPNCGDISCALPFEFPAFGELGCQSDCGLAPNVTTLNVTLTTTYATNALTTELMQAAFLAQTWWNLCLTTNTTGSPTQQCLFTYQQNFSSPVGVTSVLIDAPDADYQLVVNAPFGNVLGTVQAVGPGPNNQSAAPQATLITWGYCPGNPASVQAPPPPPSPPSPPAPGAPGAPPAPKAAGSGGRGNATAAAAAAGRRRRLLQQQQQPASAEAKEAASAATLASARLARSLLSSSSALPDSSSSSPTPRHFAAAAADGRAARRLIAGAPKERALVLDIGNSGVMVASQPAPEFDPVPGPQARFRTISASVFAPVSCLCIVSLFSAWGVLVPLSSLTQKAWLSIADHAPIIGFHSASGVRHCSGRVQPRVCHLCGLAPVHKRVRSRPGHHLWTAGPGRRVSGPGGCPGAHHGVPTRCRLLHGGYGPPQRRRRKGHQLAAKDARRRRRFLLPVAVVGEYHRWRGFRLQPAAPHRILRGAVVRAVPRGAVRRRVREPVRVRDGPRLLRSVGDARARWSGHPGAPLVEGPEIAPRMLFSFRRLAFSALGLALLHPAKF